MEKHRTLIQKSNYHVYGIVVNYSKEDFCAEIILWYIHFKS
jgi:hypothetical protein